MFTAWATAAINALRPAGERNGFSVAATSATALDELAASAVSARMATRRALPLGAENMKLRKYAAR